MQLPAGVLHLQVARNRIKIPSRIYGTVISGVFFPFCISCVKNQVDINDIRHRIARGGVLTEANRQLARFHFQDTAGDCALNMSHGMICGLLIFGYACLATTRKGANFDFGLGVNENPQDTRVLASSLMGLL